LATPRVTGDWPLSSIAKLLSILELFSEARPFLSAEQVAAELQCSVPTAYRYLRELVDTGMLLRFVGGNTASARASSRSTTICAFPIRC